jgi:uncharacterized protein (DUF885 family)
VSASADLAALAVQARDAVLAFDPVLGTQAGDHEHDDRLPDLTGTSVDAHVRVLDALLERIDGVDDLALAVDEQVDLEVLRARLAADSFDLSEIARYRWDPLVWDPASGLHALAIRDFAPPEERLHSAHGRLCAVPNFLHSARTTLKDMSAIHVETALLRLEGFDSVLDELAALGTLDATAVDGARDAVAEHGAWLVEQLPQSRRDPRLGVRLYSAALWHHLDEELAPVQVLEIAEAHLDEVTARMRETAAEYLGESVHSSDIVRRALADVAERAVVDRDTVVPTIRLALDRSTRFVQEHDLVTLPDQDVDVVDMPRIHRGVAVAYCDAPGPLETAPLRTVVAVAPPPDDWPPERVQSFLREYNGDLLHDLAIHEAMPGHVVQLARARAADTSLIRRLAPSGVFIEGWAVYAEELLIDRGYAPDDAPRAHARMRLQQLKMQARATLNAILDARVHGGDIDEVGAIELLRRRGFQEEAEAAGKWRRALLTATQLPTYFVGWRGVRQLIDDLRVLHPDWSDRRLHDLVLEHGSLGPRHLRAVLGL